MPTNDRANLGPLRLDELPTRTHNPEATAAQSCAPAENTRVRLTNLDRRRGHLAKSAHTGHYAPVADPSAETLSEAIVVWTGYGVTSFPQRDERRVAAQFGVEAAVELVPLMAALQKDFYKSTAYNTVAGLAEMAAQAASEFRGRHRDLSDEAVEAFAWCYSWDWK